MWSGIVKIYYEYNRRMIKLRARQSPFVLELLVTESWMKKFLKIVNSEKSKTLIRTVRDGYLLSTGTVSRVVMSSLVYNIFHEVGRMRNPLCSTIVWDPWDKLLSGTYHVSRRQLQRKKVLEIRRIRDEDDQSYREEVMMIYTSINK